MEQTDVGSIFHSVIKLRWKSRNEIDDGLRLPGKFLFSLNLKGNEENTIKNNILEFFNHGSLYKGLNNGI